MEGQATISNKIRFAELKRKFRVVQNGYKSPGEKLVAAANDHGLIIIASEDSVKAISLDTLLDFNQSKPSIAELNQFNSSFDLDFRPTLLSVNKATLLVIGTSQSNCPVIEAINLNSWKSIGKQHVNSCKNHQVIDYAWHPNYPDIVVLCTNQGCLLVLFISKQNGVALVCENQQYGALTCCWSPKGKNLAIGTAQGNVQRLEPVITNSSFSFKEVDKSTINFHPRTTITPDHQVVRLRWINRTSLLCVHAKHTGDPDTVHSMILVKPSKPFVFWKNLYCESNNLQNHKVYLANLSSIVICTSNLTGEAAVIGVEGDKEPTDLTDWKSILIDEEGARIELPLDSNNIETHSMGVTIAMSSRFPDNPILVFLTNDGVLCPYSVLHSDPNLKLPDPQPELNLPLDPKNLSFGFSGIGDMTFGMQSVLSATTPKSGFKELQASNNSLKGQALPRISSAVVQEFPPKVTQDANNSVKDLSVQKVLSTIASDCGSKELQDAIKSLKVQTSTLKKMAPLEEINMLREQFAEIEEFHEIHQEALEAMKDDIDNLRLSMLESWLLIEYIKKRSAKLPDRKIDPNTLDRVEKLKKQSKVIATRLEDLNLQVEVTWETFVRSKGVPENRKMNSLEMIYKTLATNQKIINVLKTKVPELNSTSILERKSEFKDNPVGKAIDLKELDPAKMRSFREFLSSRTVVPVRRPIK